MLKPLSQKDGDDKKEGSQGKSPLGEHLPLVINLVVTVVLLVIFTIVIYALMDSMITKKFAALTKGNAQTEDTTEVSESEERGVVLDLGDFILNLSDTNPRRFLKVNVAIELSKTEEEMARAQAPVEKKGGGHGGGHGGNNAADPTADIIAEMDTYKPAIRDAVITTLTSKTSDELSTSTGKELAKEEIQDAVDSLFSGTRSVLRVSFGQFVIQ